VFIFVGVANLPISFTEFSCSVHIGQELLADHLDRLTVQPETAFGSVLQDIPVGPAGMLLPGRQMEIATRRPHAGSFLLCSI
jgi:hypothetical protein